ncbi:bHLH protein family-like [Hordeum vulgare]|nr:bHLH protein family-like [Hordeum vulgare]
MDFDTLNSHPEAQLELMNAMLQLEQLTALPDHGMPAPPSPCTQTASPRHHFSSAPHMASANVNAGGPTTIRIPSLPLRPLQRQPSPLRLRVHGDVAAPNRRRRRYGSGGDAGDDSASRRCSR